MILQRNRKLINNYVDAKKNRIGKLKVEIDLLAQEHKNLQTSNKLKALTKENQKSDNEPVKKSTSKKTNYQGYYGAKTLEGKKSDDDFTTK
jgi:hypothetical protein